MVTEGRVKVISTGIESRYWSDTPMYYALIKIDDDAEPIEFRDIEPFDPLERGKQEIQFREKREKENFLINKFTKDGFLSKKEANELLEIVVKGIF